MLNTRGKSISLILLLSLVCISLCFSGDTTGPCVDAENEAIQLPEVPRTATPETGHVTEYWPNGQLKSECAYKNGEMLNGTYYASNGTLIYEMVAESGKVQVPLFPSEARPDTGTVVVYWPNGEVKSESTFKDGKAITAAFYTSEGTLACEVSAESRD